MRSEVEFYSCGELCRGWLYLPDEGAETGPWPAVVMAGGWCYVREFVMPQYAEHLARNGVASLVFDYRNFGASDGARRQHADPWQQIEDYRSALSYLSGLQDVDSERLGVWGISYSGGHVLILAAIDRRIKAAVSVVPVIDGEENMRRAHGHDRFIELRDLVETDRDERCHTGKPGGDIPYHTVDPTTDLCTWPFADSYTLFEDLRRQAPLFENRSTVESVDRLLTYSVFPYVARATRVPIAMIIAADDEKTPADLQVKAFDAIPNPHKVLIDLSGAGHRDLYAGETQIAQAVASTVDWFTTHLHI